jgi:hypothetical protein
MGLTSSTRPTVQGCLEKLRNADKVCEEKEKERRRGARSCRAARWPGRAFSHAPPFSPLPRQDFRYMALSDLEGLLDPDLSSAALAAAATAAPPPDPPKLDEAMQTNLAAAVVERLGDASADVATQAVKW